MKQFFREDSEYSMMRLLSFLAVTAGITLSVVTIVLVMLHFDLLYIRESILLIATLLGFGFGGKAVQKFGEN